MTEAACQFITPVTMQALSNRPVHTSQWDAREPNNMAHINLTRDGRCGAGGAGQRRLHGQAGHGARRRVAQPAVPGTAAGQLPAAAGAGDEPRDVGPPGDAAQRGAVGGRRRQHPGPGRRRPGLRRNRRRAHARGARAVRRDGGVLPAQAARRQACADHRRPDLRGHRPGARHQQPVQRQDGLCHRACRAAGGGAGHLGRRSGGTGHAAPCAPQRCAKRAADARCGAAAGAAARRLHRHRRGGRLAPCRSERAQDQEGRLGQRAAHRDDPEPRHPGQRGAAARLRPIASALPPRATTWSNTRAPSACARACR